MAQSLRVDLLHENGIPPDQLLTVCCRWSVLFCRDLMWSLHELVHVGWQWHERLAHSVDSCIHVHERAAFCVSVTTQKTTGFWLKFCVPLDFLIAALDPEERSLKFLFHFQNSERRNGQSQGAPWTRFGWLKLFFADAHRNKLGLSGFARRKSGLGLSVFGCVGWSTLGELAPHWYVLNPANYRFRQITEVKHRRAGLVPGWVTTQEHPVL